MEAADEERTRDDEESVRVAYVAATRARELLVVPVVGDEERPGWVDLLNPVVYPPRESWRRNEPAPACPPFRDDSVLDRGSSRGPKRKDRGPGSVHPGQHAPQLGGHRVVWWDPRALDLGREEQVGLRQERILVADEAGAGDRGIAEHEAWQKARAEALASGRTASLDVRSVTVLSEETTLSSELKALSDSPELKALSEDRVAADVAFESVDVDRASRPGGRRFGILVHAVLAAVPLDADSDTVDAVARVQARLLGASADEVVAAGTAVRAALAHDVLRRAAAAAGQGGLRRETPVLLRREDGVLAEGVVDLAFREDAGWTVVDFKTDREIEGARARYEAQVGLYCQAIEAATGEPARGVLLRV
jgi:ATP-dependent exoDNAse (exonuclease V) beta subunit